MAKDTTAWFGASLQQRRRLFCGMMDGLAFLPVTDLTNGIHLLRTLCPIDPPGTGNIYAKKQQ